MSDWTSGYVVDVSYTHGFYKELAPSFLSFAALVQGYAAPGLGRSPSPIASSDAVRAYRQTFSRAPIRMSSSTPRTSIRPTSQGHAIWRAPLDCRT